MAEVRLAVDLTLDRRVVVKLLAPDANRARFEREARAAAALGHPNIVQLFDFGEEAGRPYMVFEHLSGGSLEERLCERPMLREDEVAAVAADVAAGLAHAHERGVVHRDLKPANILFDSEDRAKIADLGIASLRGSDPLTDAGTVLGTVAYISPEQTRGEPATPASDVYSYGVVLYRLLAGRLPFDSTNAAELAAMHRDAAPPPFEALPPGTDQMATLALASLAKSPEARPADGAALLRALTAPVRGVEASAAETQVLRVGATRRRLTSTPLVAATTLLVLAAAGVLTAAVLTHDPASAPATPANSSTAARATSTSEVSHATTARSTSVSSSSIETKTEPSSSTSRPTTTVRSTRQETTAPVTTAPETTVPETALPETTTP